MPKAVDIYWGLQMKFRSILVLAAVVSAFYVNSAFSQDLSIEAARSKYATNIATIKTILANPSSQNCSSRQNMSDALSNAIKDLDIIIAKSKDSQELEIAKTNRNQLSGMLSQSVSAYDQNCGAGAQKRQQNIEVRDRYINEYNTNIIAAQRFRDRAFNQDTNNYEMCNSLHAERSSLSEAKTDFAVLSGRLPEFTAEEDAQNKKLINKIQQNQVDGKAYGCW